MLREISFLHTEPELTIHFCADALYILYHRIRNC